MSTKIYAIKYDIDYCGEHYHHGVFAGVYLSRESAERKLKRLELAERVNAKDQEFKDGSYHTCYSFWIKEFEIVGV